METDFCSLAKVSFNKAIENLEERLKSIRRLLVKIMENQLKQSLKLKKKLKRRVYVNIKRKKSK